MWKICILEMGKGRNEAEVWWGWQRKRNWTCLHDYPHNFNTQMFIWTTEPVHTRAQAPTPKGWCLWIKTLLPFYDHSSLRPGLQIPVMCRASKKPWTVDLMSQESRGLCAFILSGQTWLSLPKPVLSEHTCRGHWGPQEQVCWWSQRSEPNATARPHSSAVDQPEDVRPSSTLEVFKEKILFFAEL